MFFIPTSLLFLTQVGVMYASHLHERSHNGMEQDNNATQLVNSSTPNHNMVYTLVLELCPSELVC